MGTLGFASLVLIECLIVKYNIGAPNIDEYVSLLVSNGFVPFVIEETHYAANILIQIDFIFMRERHMKSIFGTAITNVNNVASRRIHIAALTSGTRIPDAAHRANCSVRGSFPLLCRSG
jgi:hypothetical protein